MEGRFRLGAALLLVVSVRAQAAVAPRLGAGQPGGWPLPSLAGSPTGHQLLGETPDDAQVEAASRVKARHEDALLRIPGVVGLGVGLASETDEVVIQVYTAGVAEQDRRLLPAVLEGIRVVVIETGEFTPR
jgi:hypothetical protein